VFNYESREEPIKQCKPQFETQEIKIQDRQPASLLDQAKQY